MKVNTVWLVLLLLIIQLAGTLASASAIVLSEIMYHPASGNEDYEYIELFNRSDAVVDLTGWSLVSAVDYTFAGGVSLGPDQYLVVAKSAPDFLVYYQTQGVKVIGGYQGKLSNGGETLRILDAHDVVVDELSYGDGGQWPKAADGQGPSLELIHPSLDNSHPRAWAAGPDGGTPGRPNVMHESNPKPIVEVLRHDPPVPAPTDRVEVTAWITDDSMPAEVTLYLRDAQNPWMAIAMTPSGRDDDGLWIGTIPAQIQGTIVEFYVSVLDPQGQTGLAPLSAPQGNCLYQVDGVVHTTPRETYRVVLTDEDWTWLFKRSVNSDDLLNCTFIAGDEIRYNAGFRFRGNSSRNFPPPKNFRVQFTNTDYLFMGLERLNLNGVDDDPRNSWDMAIGSHELGHDFLDRANQLTLDHQLISFVTNNTFWPNYIYLSAIDDVFARLRFPGDDGNLYRCITYTDPAYPKYKGAELDYRGTDPNAYRPNYYKRTNEEEDDWADLIALTDILNNTPDDQYAQRVREVVDVEQWMGFFAALNLISYQEGGIHAGQGTEYSMYRRESDGRFVMIPWDMDENFRKVNQPLFTQTLPAVKRFIRHPELVALYYDAFRRLLDGPFSEEEMRRATERYRGLLQDSFLDQVNDFVKKRRAYILSKLPSSGS